MKAYPEFDVIIAGGGMVGLSMALALANSGLRLALVDQFAPPGVEAFQASLTEPDFDSRVSALTPATVALLDALGVWQPLQALRVSPYTRMRVWDAEGTGAISFNANELHIPCLGHIVENRLITAVLADALRACDQVKSYFGQALTDLATDDAGHHLSLADGSVMHARLLIGADGGRSRIREWAGFATRTWSYEQQALVTTVRTELSHQHTAWQRFMTTGPLAFLPLHLPGADTGHISSIVWTCDPALASELLALPETTFARRCASAFESTLGTLELLAPVQGFPLQQLHAVDYVKPGLALIGDAAHTIHPLAGQGVNLGFADAQCLAGVIHQAMAQGQDFTSHQVLSRYQRARKPANLGMMASMEGFKRLFGSDDLMVRWLRNAGLQVADNLSPIKQLLMKQAMGLK